MTATAIAPRIELEATDVQGQKLAREEVAPDESVGAIVDRFLGRMRLTRNDPEGRPLTYHARLDREGRHLHATERVGDALQPGDRLVLQPNIDAGGEG